MLITLKDLKQLNYAREHMAGNITQRLMVN